MIFHVVISRQAEDDLRSIYEYIAFELLAPENAAGQLERLEKMILSLKEMPERFSRYHNEPWRSRGLRFVAVDHYLVYYFLDVKEYTVIVFRVMYDGQDINKKL